MYNLLGLRIRWLWIAALCIIGALILVVFRKKVGKSGIIVTSLLLVVLFIYGSFSVLNSLKKPTITRFVGVFHSEARRRGISFFEYEYCFDTDNGKLYIDMDALSKRIIYPSAFIVGESYEVTYEKTQNLIVGVKKTEGGRRDGSPVS